MLIDRVPASDVKLRFYIHCLLHVLCAATAACDLLANIFRVSNNLICKNIILASVVQDHINSRSLQFRIGLLPTFNRIVDVQNTVNACCDFTPQSIILRKDHSNRDYHPFIHLNLQRSNVVGS